MQMCTIYALFFFLRRLNITYCKPKFVNSAVGHCLKVLAFGCCPGCVCEMLFACTVCIFRV